MQPDFWSSYPHRAGFKEPTTSAEAAQRIEAKGRAATLRQRVLAWFRCGQEGTADQAAEALGESVLAIRPRVTELYKQHLIEPTGTRGSNQSGSTAHVWRLKRDPL